jgi:hypothetical protein
MVRSNSISAHAATSFPLVHTAKRWLKDFIWQEITVPVIAA